MKKFLVCAMTLLLSISCVIPVKSLNNEVHEETIRSFVYSFDNKIVDVEYIRILKDINNQDSFELYKIDDDGYAIMTIGNENIVEITYSDFPTDSLTYYLGPGAFYEELPTAVSMYSLNHNEELKESIENMKDTVHQFLNEQHIEFEYTNTERSTHTRPYPNQPSEISGGTSLGLDDSDMDIFNGTDWASSNDRCGAWAAAVMITCMDKFHGGKYFKESGSYSTGNIISRLTSQITGYSNANQVINAINTIFLADYPSGGKHGSSTSNVNTIKTKISNDYPVCLLLQTFLGSGYGNHWVCAYRYVEYNGATWYKVHDNWSEDNHRGWVKAGWVYKGVYTN